MCTQFFITSVDQIIAPPPRAPQSTEHQRPPSSFLFLIWAFFFGGGGFRATLVAYGGSQARGRIGAVAAGLHHSHSHTRSSMHGARPGIEPASLRMLVRFLSTEP